MKSNVVNKSKLKHILVTFENFEKIRKYGYAGESLNDAISKILEKSEKFEFGKLPSSQSKF